MATGIPAQHTGRQKHIPLTLSYDGKSKEEDVFRVPERDFSIRRAVNGASENRFFFGDNLYALSYLLRKGYGGKITLIYIDPPFSTDSEFVCRTQTHAYSDALAGGEYVEFLRRRLFFLRELLCDRGSIYLHLDHNMVFPMKLVMDEVFGAENHRAFITRKKCSTKNYTKRSYGNISDYILFYSKSADYVWNRPFDPWEYDRMIEEYPCTDEKTGRRYKKVPLHAPGVRNGETGKAWRGKLPPTGKHWQYTPDKLDALDRAGEIYWSSTGNPRRIVFCDPLKGVPVQNIWLHYRDSVNQAQKTTGYPTEKNLAMMKMMIGASSNPGDFVLDCFAGSGSTLQAAHESGRVWIGVDNSPESLRAVLRRFTAGLETYGDYVTSPGKCLPVLSFEERCPFTLLSNGNEETTMKQILEEFQLQIMS